MDQEVTYKWIQDRLRDLHSGTISEADRLRLEEVAKSDPFVKDAMEGYEINAHHDHSALLRLLEQRIKNKSASRHAKLMPLSRGWVLQAVAASLVIILATWAVIYYVDQSNETVIATADRTAIESGERITEVTLTQPDSSTDDIVSTTGTSPDELTSEPPGLRANAQAKMKAETKADAKAKEGAGRKEDVIVKAEPEYTFNDPDVVKPEGGVTQDDKQSDPSPPAAAKTYATDADLSVKSMRDEGYYANQMDPAVLARRVTGKVHAENGEPLIGVQLSVPNTNLVTLTGTRGQFELFLPAPESFVDVLYSGYVDASIQLKQGDEDVVIILPEKNKSFDEVVVYTTEAKVQTQNVPAGRAYAPTRARESSTTFTEYLRNNTRIPIQENLNALAREVMLEFTVSSKGRPEQIRVVRSSDNREYDEEAVRLIRKGPDWDCELGLYPCVAHYTIYFQ